MLSKYHGTSATEPLYDANLANVSHDQLAVVMVTSNYILGCWYIKKSFIINSEKTRMFAVDKLTILGCYGLQEVMGVFPNLHIHRTWVNV